MSDYFINPMWFYWINLLDGIKTLGIIVLTLEGIFFGIANLCCLIEEEEENILIKFFKNKITIIITILGLIVTLFCPSKQACKEMLIASVVSKENVEHAEDKIKDTIDYIIDKLDNEKD